MNLALSESLGQELRFAKESTKSELRNSSYDQTKFEFNSDLIQILNFSKTCLSWINGYRES